jgi:calcineurin-like phosphoesterase family protein
MDDTIIKNFNAILKPNDELYILGDTCFTGRDLRGYMANIPGQKFCILGNHDPKQFDSNIFAWVKDVKMIKVGEQHIFLSHYAHRQWPQSHYGAWHLYGHDHGTLEDFGMSTDVGVDSWDYKPVSFDQLKERFKGREPRKHH